MRRLPVYLLIDISGSMRGEPIEAVKEGMQSLVDTLRQDPYALETVYLSIIAFNNEVHEILPLTELYKVQLTNIEAKLGTYIGKALRYLSAKVDVEVIKNSSEHKGDWRPITFIMTDGRSGDSVEKSVKEIDIKSLGMIVACATGNEPNLNALHLITENVVQLKSLDRESIGKFFKWISQSVASSSMQLMSSYEDLPSIEKLPPPPKDIQFV